MIKPAGLNTRDSFSQEPSQALERMMELYGTSVLRTAYFYMGDRHLAEDISQEVFLRAYRNWLKFRGNSQVKTWLTSITINVCRDKLGLKMSTEEPTDPSLLDLNHTVSVEREVLERLKNSEMLQHVMKLPKLYQEILYLYYYLDFSTPEIAEATLSTEGTVRTRLHRARELLGQELKKEGFIHERS